MTDKLFSVAGTATNPDGTTKVRFANDLVSRNKILNKAGCTNINLIELPRPMTKLEVLKYLTQVDSNFDSDAVAAIYSRLEEKTQEAKRGEVRVAGSKTVQQPVVEAQEEVVDPVVDTAE
jgi:hypothetical protein